MFLKKTWAQIPQSLNKDIQIYIYLLLSHVSDWWTACHRDVRFILKPLCSISQASKLQSERKKVQPSPARDIKISFVLLSLSLLTRKGISLFNGNAILVTFRYLVEYLLQTVTSQLLVDLGRLGESLTQADLSVHVQCYHHTIWPFCLYNSLLVMSWPITGEISSRKASHFKEWMWLPKVKQMTKVFLKVSSLFHMFARSLLLS